MIHLSFYQAVKKNLSDYGKLSAGLDQGNLTFPLSCVILEANHCKGERIPMKKIIQCENAPKAIGPYSQAVEAGSYLYVSGQIPIDPATGELVPGGIQEQSAQSLKNVKAIVEKAGYTMADVIKTTVLLKNIEDFQAMNAVYAEYFTGGCPARAAFGVAALPKGAMVEIEAIVYTGK